MDLQLLKTFLEVAATGSFGAAAGRLFVTQSAVSLRVHRLEDQLGRPLFDRRKDGVTLTSVGREFRGFATLILRNWEQARQRVSAMNAAPTTFAVAAQSSLWPRFGFRWLDRLREEMPDLVIRADMARPDALVQMILSGAVQAVLSYDDVVRPGLTSQPLMEDQLVMVSPWPDAAADSVVGRYAMVDWGPEFQRAHDEALPHLAEARLILGMGTLATVLACLWSSASKPGSHNQRGTGQGNLPRFPFLPSELGGGPAATVEYRDFPESQRSQVGTR